MASQAKTSGTRLDTSWRSALRRRIGWTLLLKLVALFALWFLFFSPAHRVQVTPKSVEAAIAVDAASPPGTRLAEGNADD